MGLGLARGAAFEESIEEQSISLQHGDLCVFYTDGVTEARRGDDEFGYERLLETVVRSRTLSASMVKDHILETVKTHIDHKANDDDLTLVVLKWCSGA
jgi:sigma-B regulation protein RsbU (phosphoserine phosphatase)